MIIALDGPAGSGKSTIAKRVASQLGFTYLDTGAMYRAVAWLALHRGINLDDGTALGRIAADEPIDFDNPSQEAQDTELTGVSISGQDVTTQIRTPQVDAVVSKVSAHAEVRRALVDAQRRIGAGRDVVMEGRDIATVVFPAAEVKIFLTASPEVRAARRFVQNATKDDATNAQGSGAAGDTSQGNSEKASFMQGNFGQDSFAKGDDQTRHQQMLEQINRRDKLDSERDLSPLRAATDSVIIDTSEMTIEQVCQKIVALVCRWQCEHQCEGASRPILPAVKQHDDEGDSHKAGISLQMPPSIEDARR
ncbi:MAG: (d)CMP kinase [Coriobacteriales bacterium]|jgi:cytidylate kinase|nr:(d)CMP kinase [Coriobacteriales bacterium]